MRVLVWSRRLAADRRGVSAVEFALLSPLFIGLLFGIVTFGVHLAAVNSVSQLGGDVARVALAGLDEAERIAIAEDYVRDNIDRYVLLDPERLTFRLADRPDGSQQFDVSVEYDASRLPVAVWARMFRRPDPVIRAETTIRHGGF